ncbi:MAG: flagellar hook-length control protein FliK [Pigmentiphaga sp.]|uniref:flagellar hook-length control protein FliK n=1 Tax=Pigmentiphaga sp. TaxID=1977564 RepID=UPI0029B24310|nr:flagellar hook-length control protein FliK [Pigmentiphaga sp.]MDX3904136.1 flagellar hook-length control protein FliK [Pigmentiphaga sp.]
MVDSRPTQPVTGVVPVQGWERYREDAREAILARLLNMPSARGPGPQAGAQAGSGLPHGLVRATVIQAHSASEALVDIGGKPYLVNTRQALTAGASVILRLLDDRTFLQSQGAGRPDTLSRPADRQAHTGAGGPGELAAAAGDKAGRTDSARSARGVVPVPMPALAELNTETGDAKIRLSGSARLLFALISETGSVQRSVPLASLDIPADADPALAARRMQQAVEQSGLFYESHLQEWRDGRRSLEALRAEPQAALSPGPQPKPAGGPVVSVPDPQPPATPEQAATKGLQAALGAIPSDVRPIVQDQIALLASGRMLLEGAWGGAPFTLEVEPDAAGRHDDDLPLAWQVRIRVETPHLGKLEVDLALSGTDARVAVRPDAKALRGQRLREVQAQLAAGGPALREALDSRGLHMSDLRVASAARPPARP